MKDLRCPGVEINLTTSRRIPKWSARETREEKNFLFWPGNGNHPFHECSVQIQAVFMIRFGCSRKDGSSRAGL